MSDIAQVKDIVPRIQYTASAGQTVFVYPFPVFDAGDIVVEQNGTVLTLSTDYTVSDVAAEDGGNITLTSGATSGDIMTIYRDMALERLIDYQQNGDFLAANVNRDFDRVWLAMQQLQGGADAGEGLGRSWRAAPDDTLTDSELVIANLATRAGRFVGFDSNGKFTYSSPAISSDPSQIYSDVLTMQNDASLTVGQFVRTVGYTTAGDGGGNDYEIVAAGTGTDDGGSFIDLPGSGLQAKGLFPGGEVRAEQFGVFPGEANQTGQITAAISFHLLEELPLSFAPGDYVFDGMTYSTAPFRLNIAGRGGVARFIGTASTDRMFRFTTTDNVGTYTLAVDVVTGQDYFDLVDASGIEKGMMIRLTSDTLWPYDDRGVYFKGETHLVREVVGDRVHFTDRTRDNYTTAEINNITVWLPNSARLKNISSDMSEFGGAACYQINRCAFPVFENVHSEGAASVGLWMLECWETRCKNIFSTNIGDGVAVGYGAQDRSGVGTTIDGLYTNGCRRSFDAESQSGVNSSPARDYKVTNFVAHGGGAYWPETAETSYGIGNHGPSENGQYSNGIIHNCEIGVNHRGSTLSLSNIDIYGRCRTPVDLTFGVGVNIDNVNYYPEDYPNKGTDFSDVVDLPEVFARFGRAANSDADWNFELPVRISNCSAVGVQDGFLFFEGNTQQIRNVQANSNVCFPSQEAAAPVFNFLRHLSTVAASRFDGNQVISEARAWRFNNGNLGEFQGLTREYAVVVDGVHIIRILDDDWGIAGVFGRYPGARPLIALSADAAGRELFQIIAETAALSVEGNSTIANLTGTATPTAINGTFGVDGDFTIGMTPEGAIYLENRGGSNREFRLATLV